MNTVDDPSKLYSYQIAGNMAGRVVPRRGFAASAYAAGEGHRDINTRLKNKYHMNLSESIGFLGRVPVKL